MSKVFGWCCLTLSILLAMATVTGIVIAIWTVDKAPRERMLWTCAVSGVCSVITFLFADNALDIVE